MEKTIRFSISISPDLLKKFDDASKEKMYTSRSKAIRDLIVNFVVEREWEKSESEVMGSLTLLYDHDAPGLVNKIIDIQHERTINIISAMHVHIDERNCMEILALRGLPKEIREVADKLISIRGIKQGKLVMSSMGREIK